MNDELTVAVKEKEITAFGDFHIAEGLPQEIAVNEQVIEAYLGHAKAG